MKTFKEIILLPINLIRALVGIFKSADDYAKQKEWEDGGWEEAERRKKSDKG